MLLKSLLSAFVVIATFCKTTYAHPVEEDLTIPSEKGLVNPAEKDLANPVDWDPDYFYLSPEGFQIYPWPPKSNTTVDNGTINNGTMDPDQGTAAVVCDRWVDCDNNHMAKASLCLDFLFALKMNTNIIKDSPRSICWENPSISRGRCCLSWANNHHNAVYYNEFVPHAYKVLNFCTRTGNPKISGSYNGNGKYDQCARLCVSDRPNGC